MEILELGGADAVGTGARRALEVLEAGGLVRLRGAAFDLKPLEAELLDASIVDARTKNVSFDPATGRLGGSPVEGARRERLEAMVVRYGVFADELVARIAPAYRGRLQKRRTSFRPAAIETRALSPRKDDKRLHVDAFPSSPVQGRRILRVFTNVHPTGRPREWRLYSEGFERLAQAFRDRLRPPARGALWRERLGLTKGLRTPYDAAMLALHDGAKLDDAWQASAPASALSFAPGESWIVFTDAAAHAAMSGQHAFEQTYLLPVEAMAAPERSPLRTLERILGRRLV